MGMEKGVGSRQLGQSMAVRETSLWKWLKNAKKHYTSDLAISRIENLAGSGTPDVEGHLSGFGQFWVELKVCDRPKRTTTALRPKIRPAQIAWITRRVKVGGNVWVLLQVEKTRYLVKGKHIRLLDTGINEEELGGISIKVDTPQKAVFLMVKKLR